MKLGRWAGLSALLAAGLLACAVPGLVSEGAMETGFIRKRVKVDGETYKYALYVPPGYTEEKPWPLIVFLHGVGERGDDGWAQTKVGIGPHVREHPERFPALILMPQVPDGEFYDSVRDVMLQQIVETQENYNIDPQRVYLTGISMGGFGTWLWGAQQAELFAALMPICGGGSATSIASRLGMDAPQPFGTYEERVQKLKTLPIWAFHGAEDEVVPPAQSRQTVELVREAGGDVRYTEYPGLGHNSWDATYSDPEVIEWLLSQRKEER